MAMVRFVIYSPDGRILRDGITADSNVSLQVQDGEAVLVVSEGVQTDTHKIVFVDGVAVPVPM